MIDGFPEQPSLCPGERLVLRVSTDAPVFRVEFYRCGAQLTPMGRSDWLDGRWAPPHLPYQDWGRPNKGLRGEELPAWPGYPLTLPADWPPGVYLAVLVPGDGPGRRSEPDADLTAPAGATARDLDARTGRCLFVLRSAAPSARILYKLPLLTYHAYNQVVAHPVDPVDGHLAWCLYTLPPAAELPRPVPPAVSVRRPGGGVGGTPWDMFNFDPFDPTPRQTFSHWDAPFIAWLERAGYRLDYCTDLDLHRRPPRPYHDGHGGGRAGNGHRGYRLLLSAGHDEYWSERMREHAERFVADGGNIAFFGGNTCWWRVSFEGGAGGEGLAGREGLAGGDRVAGADGVAGAAVSFRRVDNWPDRPENLLTGVSFRNGGERDRDEHPIPVGYRVQHADHWVYAGTGLGDGDVFGDGPDEYLVGYECDGAHFDRADLARGRPARPTGEDGTPASFTILGVGDTSRSGWGQGNRAATLGLYTAPGGGTVFTSATTDWPRLLATGCLAVETITRNVLDHLG